VGHNITTNVCVNYKDKAMFTFIHDAKLFIKVAVLDLTKISEDQEEESQKQMKWVLKMEQSQHNLDRFHLKCGVTMADNRIAVIARGRLPDMRE
jgi:GTP-binding protein EngB required for normal cell division